MALRRWLLGLDPEEVKILVGKVSTLEAELEDLKKRLQKVEDVAHKIEVLEERLRILDLVTDQTKENRLMIRELLKDIEDLNLEIEAIKLKSEADSSIKEKPDDIELEARVYDLVRKGVTSPTKLSQMAGISKDKLYRILNRLIEGRLITTIGKGRKKKYIPREEAEEEESG